MPKKIISENGNIMVTDVRVPFEYKTFKNNLDIYPVEIVYYTKYVSLKDN